MPFLVKTPSGGFISKHFCQNLLTWQNGYLSDTPTGILGAGVEISACKSNSFSSRKWISLPPPLAKRKGSCSAATQPYSGSWPSRRKAMSTSSHKSFLRFPCFVYFPASCSSCLKRKVACSA